MNLNYHYLNPYKNNNDGSNMIEYPAAKVEEEQTEEQEYIINQDELESQSQHNVRGYVLYVVGFWNSFFKLNIAFINVEPDFPTFKF